MNTPPGAREAILGKIRAALPGAPLPIETSYASVHRNYRRGPSLDREACINLFVDRLIDYDAEVIQLPDEAALPQAIEQSLAHGGEERLLIAREFPHALVPRVANLIIDDHLSTPELDRAQAVLTTCEAAVASTGTIFLVHAGAQGRRVLTLLPDHHLCIVRRSQVFESVPEALAAIASLGMLPITSISGPSATSDIEMTRIRGVHGPRRLTVLLYGKSTLGS